MRYVTYFTNKYFNAEDTVLAISAGLVEQGYLLRIFYLKSVLNVHQDYISHLPKFKCCLAYLLEQEVEKSF